MNSEYAMTRALELEHDNEQMCRWFAALIERRCKIEIEPKSIMVTGYDSGKITLWGFEQDPARGWATRWIEIDAAGTIDIR